MPADYNLAIKLVDIALKQREAGINYKRPRLRQIQESEDAYMNKVKRQLKGRFNYPLPIIPGFVDSLKSKIDDTTDLRFKHGKESAYKAAQRVQGMWDRDFGDNAYNGFSFQDRQAKTFAVFSGRGIMKYFANSVPGYQANLEAIDYYDFYCEPLGGAMLENHIFIGQDNIMRSKKQLVSRAESGVYYKESLAQLESSYVESYDIAKDSREYEDRFNRQRALGLTPQQYLYNVDKLYNLTEHYLVYEGERYYLLFDPRCKLPVRCCLLKEMFESDLYPYRSWATHEDLKNFWSKAPVDDIMPVADAIRNSFNEMMNNLQRRNWAQRAFDTKTFADPSLLAWQPDGLVPAQGNPREGIYTFDVPDTTTITVNIMSFLDSFIGQKTGITPGSQGDAGKDKKVRVYFGELQQVADRLGLYNKSYSECWEGIGRLYVNGLLENLNGKEAIEIMGERGKQWDNIEKQDVRDFAGSGRFSIMVVGRDSEQQVDEMRKQKRQASLDQIINAKLPVNSQWLVENILRVGEFDEDEIHEAMDLDSYGQKELLSEAADAIEKILKGKQPQVNRGANAAFMQKIIDFATDEDIDDKMHTRLMEYAMAHVDIARENMLKRAQNILKMQNYGQPPQTVGGAAEPAGMGARGAGNDATMGAPDQGGSGDPADAAIRAVPVTPAEVTA